MPGRNLFEERHGVVGEVSDGPPREGRIASLPPETGPDHHPVDDIQSTALPRISRPVSFDRYARVAKLDSGLWRRSEERIARDATPALHAFEKEGLRSRREQLAHDGHGRRQVGQQRARRDPGQRRPVLRIESISSKVASTTPKSL